MGMISMANDEKKDEVTDHTTTVKANVQRELENKCLKRTRSGLNNF